MISSSGSNGEGNKEGGQARKRVGNLGQPPDRQRSPQSDQKAKEAGTGLLSSFSSSEIQTTFLLSNVEWRQEICRSPAGNKGL